MKFLKKVVFIMAIATLFGTLVGCSPKATNLWVISNDVKFNFDYQAFDVVYDGVQRNFSVKDKDVFEKTITETANYVKKIDFADTNENAMLFKVDEELFLVFNVKDNQYGMRPASCNISVDDETVIQVTCPPMSKFDYFITDLIPNIRDWDYFSDYYKLVTGAVVKEDVKSIELQTEQGNVRLEYAQDGLKIILL